MLHDQSLVVHDRSLTAHGQNQAVLAHDCNPLVHGFENGVVQGQEYESGVVHGGDQGFRGYGLDVVGNCDLEQKRRWCYGFAIDQTCPNSYQCLD